MAGPILLGVTETLSGLEKDSDDIIGAVVVDVFDVFRNVPATGIA